MPCFPTPITVSQELHYTALYNALEYGGNLLFHSELGKLKYFSEIPDSNWWLVTNMFHYLIFSIEPVWHIDRIKFVEESIRNISVLRILKIDFLWSWYLDILIYERTTLFFYVLNSFLSIPLNIPSKDIRVTRDMSNSIKYISFEVNFRNVIVKIKGSKSSMNSKGSTY